MEKVMLLLFSVACLYAYCNVAAAMLSEEDAELFAKLHHTFQPVFNTYYRPRCDSEQFAVISFNKAGTERYLVPHSPGLVMNHKPQRGDNYLAATDMELTRGDLKLDAEMRALSHIMDWVEENDIPKTIHIYSYQFPCLKCIRKIAEIAQLLTSTAIFVGYSQNGDTTLEDRFKTQLTMREANVSLSFGQVNIDCIVPLNGFSPANDLCLEQLAAQGTCLQPATQLEFDVYLYDPSNYKFLSASTPCVRGYSLPCIRPVDQTPTDDGKFKMIFLPNGKIAFRSRNKKYMGRVNYSGDAHDGGNYMEAVHATVEVPSQFVIEYEVTDVGIFNNVGTISLIADNGRYLATYNHPGGNAIKPLSKAPYKYILYF